MKLVRIHQFGGPDQLRIDEVPTPEPQARELLVRIHAASVNPVDYKIRSGKYPGLDASRLPLALGRDLSGVVERASGASGPQVGDAVIALLPRDRAAYAEYVAVPADACARKPAGLDHVAAAAVPLAALTAWQGLFDQGGLSAGQKVLVHGGAGGVGHFAIQFARAIGAEVATTVSAEDLPFVRELGAQRAIDYKRQRFEEELRDYDLVLDLISGETQDRSWAVLKTDGVLVSTLGPPRQDKARSPQQVGKSYVARVDGAQLAEVVRWIDEGKVKPFVQAVYPLAQVSTAQSRLEREHTRGKIVLQVVA